MDKVAFSLRIRVAVCCVACAACVALAGFLGACAYGGGAVAGSPASRTLDFGSPASRTLESESPSQKSPANAAHVAHVALVAYSDTYLYLDTFIEVTVYADDEAKARGAFEAAEEVFRRVHSLYSRFDENSEVYRINHAPEGERPVRVSQETFGLIKTAIGYCEQSGGAFDISLGAVSDIWGFNSGNLGYTAATVRDAPGQIAEIPAEARGYDKIIINEGDLTVGTPVGMHIDLGAIAKGYAVQEAIGALKGAGIMSALINAGGNIHVVGEKPAPGGGSISIPWKIGVRHPRPEYENELVAVASVADMAVVTSGDYERYFDYEGTRYHHIIDPQTGMPARASVSATIIAGDSVLADYLSTAVFVLGPDKGLELAASYTDVEAFVVTPDLSIAASPGIKNVAKF